MESRHDSENAERILFNMRPRELVRKLLEAWLILSNLKGTSLENACQKNMLIGFHCSTETNGAS